VIQEYNLLELLKKQAADRSRKGVVGNSGRKMPIIPAASDVNPAVISMILLINQLPQ